MSTVNPIVTAVLFAPSPDVTHSVAIPAPTIPAGKPQRTRLHHVQVIYLLEAAFEEIWDVWQGDPALVLLHPDTVAALREDARQPGVNIPLKDGDRWGNKVTGSPVTVTEDAGTPPGTAVFAGVAASQPERLPRPYDSCTCGHAHRRHLDEVGLPSGCAASVFLADDGGLAPCLCAEFRALTRHTPRGSAYKVPEAAW